MAKTADRIISTLVAHHPYPMTDNEIAGALGLPTPSVRRTRSQLQDNGMVFPHVITGVGRYAAMSFKAADYLTAGPTPHTAPIL